MDLQTFCAISLVANWWFEVSYVGDLQQQQLETMLMLIFYKTSSNGNLFFKILQVVKEILNGRSLFQIFASLGVSSLLFLNSWYAEEHEKWSLSIDAPYVLIPNVWVAHMYHSNFLGNLRGNDLLKKLYV